MAEYIEREAALDIVKRTSGDYAAAWSEILKLPVADIVQMVHGQWEAFGGRYYSRKKCSRCGWDG